MHRRTPHLEIAEDAQDLLPVRLGDRATAQPAFYFAAYLPERTVAVKGETLARVGRAPGRRVV